MALMGHDVVVAVIAVNVFNVLHAQNAVAVAELYLHLAVVAHESAIEFLDLQGLHVLTSPKKSADVLIKLSVFAEGQKSL
jgi:hypothetical protein